MPGLSDLDTLDPETQQDVKICIEIDGAIRRAGRSGGTHTLGRLGVKLLQQAFELTLGLPVALPVPLLERGLSLLVGP